MPLLKRQILDLIAQIEKYLQEGGSIGSLRGILGFSEELKNYIASSDFPKEFKSKAEKLPAPCLSKVSSIKWFHYVIYPWYLVESIKQERLLRDIGPELQNLKKGFQELLSDDIK